GKAGKLLITLAPMVLGMIGKMKKTNNVESSTLLDLIMQGGKPQPVQQTQATGGGLLGMFGSLLDKNKDGNVMDDIAKTGINMLLKNFMK
ncbi:MAG TPA: hypothetical protein PKD85_22945, partial [Saprospiraceae bacterium]|nr:hypothetical protein [Saprospiraceae bacterium]